MTAGDDALAEMRRLWALDIVDPPRGSTTPDHLRCRAFVDETIRSPLYGGWNWLAAYDGANRLVDGTVAEWCGWTCARAYGTSIPLADRVHGWASTFRLDRWARRLPIRGWTPPPAPPNAPDRLLAELDEHSTGLPPGVVPQGGDILLVGPVPGGHVLSCGVHVTMVESYDPLTRAFWTIAGNGGGLGPKGNYRRGVSREAFTIGWPNVINGSGAYHARRLIRPG